MPYRSRLILVASPTTSVQFNLQPHPFLPMKCLGHIDGETWLPATAAHSFVLCNMFPSTVGSAAQSSIFSSLTVRDRVLKIRRSTRLSPHAERPNMTPSHFKRAAGRWQYPDSGMGIPLPVATW